MHAPTDTRRSCRAVGARSCGGAGHVRTLGLRRQALRHTGVRMCCYKADAQSLQDTQL